MTDSLSAYKQQILNDFNNRPDYENEFHKQAATRLVELANLRSGLVLDIATGTGLAAIATAEAVGSAGSVLGTDESFRNVATSPAKNCRFSTDKYQV